MKLREEGVKNEKREHGVLGRHSFDKCSIKHSHTTSQHSETEILT